MLDCCCESKTVKLLHSVLCGDENEEQVRSGSDKGVCTLGSIWPYLEKTEVYQLIDRDGNGILLNLYLSLTDDVVSLDEYEQHLRTLILPFLYNKGQGQIVTPEQWMRYFGSNRIKRSAVSRSAVAANSAGEENVLNMSSEEFQLNSFVTLSTHVACWRLEHRAKYGETPLHLCFFLNTPEHIAIANQMLKLFPKLAVDIYEGERFYGQNCLHFSITHANHSAVETLIDCGTDVNSRACGSFFIPLKMQITSFQPVLLPDFSGQSYFGEYPLVFAACLEQYSIFDQLYRDDRTDPNFQDAFGNTLAHLLVIHNKPRFLYYALKLPQKRINLSIKNCTGFTPLQLACHLGYYEAFQVLADARSRLNWRFGHLESKTYLIDQLDSVNSTDGSINWNSGLHLLCMGSEPGHTDIVNRNPIVDSLLRSKWQTYVKQRFGFHLVLSVLYLLILIAALYLRPSRSQMKAAEEAVVTSSDEEQSLSEMIKFGCEVTLFVWSFLSIPFEWGMIFIEGSKHASSDRSGGTISASSRTSRSSSNLRATMSYVRMVLGFKDKLAANLGSVLLVIAGVARITDVTIVEDLCLATSIPLLFGNLMFYCRCFSHLGPFITIYYHLVRVTLAKVIVMFVFVSVGSHCVLFFFYNTSTDTSTITVTPSHTQPLSLSSSQVVANVLTNHSSYFDEDSIQSNYSYRFALLLMFLVHATFGQVDLNLIENSAYPTLGRVVLMQHGVVVTILLGCLTTAMVCTTYQQVVLSFRAENKKQWARIILILEAQMSKTSRKKKMSDYAVDKQISDPLNPASKAVGFIVTVVRDMSDACRRNRAWDNWRKLKYELYKRHFVVHDMTNASKKLVMRTHKRSSDPFMIEQLKERRRRVSVNQVCRSTNRTSVTSAGPSSNLLQNPAEHRQLDTIEISATIAETSEYSEIDTPPFNGHQLLSPRGSPRHFTAIHSVPPPETDNTSEATICL